MSFVDLDGWPVDVARLPSWERTGEQLHKNDAIFRFFQCPCSSVPGGKRRRHRISACTYLDTLRAPDAPDAALAKRLAAATTPIA